MSIRSKLIVLFVVIKVLPLIALGWVAWEETKQLGETLATQATQLVETADKAVADVGKSAIDDSVAALDERARNDIEQLTTDLAKQVAAFLYDRDEDILLAARLPPDEAIYRNFLDARYRRLVEHGKWRLAADKKSWIPETALAAKSSHAAPGASDNAKAFHYRTPDTFASTQKSPLYLEMTFVDINGNEVVKVTTSPSAPTRLLNVAHRHNTFSKAETYFSKLGKLKPGEIFVSDVIGSYVGSKIIGPYTP